MTWAYAGVWDGLPTQSMAPVLVSLCNAVGDRYQAIGKNRPSWAVVGGPKSATLVDTDFHGLPLHGGSFFTTCAARIVDLLATDIGSGVDYYGFAKTSTYAGDPTDNLWTKAELETVVGLGVLTDGPDTILNSNYSLRLKGFLDRMIYPVIIPTIGVVEVYREQSNPYDHEQVAFSRSPQDAAWAEVYVPTTPLSSGGGQISAAVLGLGSAPPVYTYARVDDYGKRYLVWSGTESGNKPSGSVSDIWIEVNYQGIYFEGGYATINGYSLPIPAIGAASVNTTVELTGCDPPTIADPSFISIEFGYLGSDSPFTRPYTASGYQGHSGNITVSITDFKTTLDISSELTDQQP